MQSFELEKKWELISNDLASLNKRTMLLSSDCYCKINLHVNNNNERSIFLELPKGSKFHLDEISRVNIKIELNKSSNFVVITSFDSLFNDIFDDLIISLFAKIKEIQSPELYFETYVDTFKKWIIFFDNSKLKKIKENQIQGIYGELIVLKKILLESQISNVDDNLMSWEGPKNSVHDFILDDKNIEVKTRLKSTNKVKISSEFQLDINDDKNLELTVICIEKDFENGSSIKDLIFEIKEIIISKLGELSIFFNSLQMLGLNHSNMDDYNEYKYTIILLTSYDCLNDDFPKLISSNIESEHIQRVRYNLELRNLDEFIIEEIDLLNVT